MGTVDGNVIVVGLIVLLIVAGIVAWTIGGKRGKSDMKAEVQNPLLGSLKLDMKSDKQEATPRQVVQRQEDSAFAEQIASKAITSEQDQKNSPHGSQKIQD